MKHSARALRTIIVALALAGFALSLTAAQEEDPIDRAVARGIELLLDMQEGETNAEWPYEGVYRVREDGVRRPVIPIGYRVGGTGIVAMSLVQAPGYAEDENRKQAVDRALTFILDSTDHQLMAHEFRSGYDVRGWGYCYGLTFLLHMKAADRIGEDRAADVERAILFFIDGIHATAIPEAGGWNYARRAGFDKPGPPSPFMTGPTLQALFEAKRQGYEVDDDVIESGLRALERARTKTGSFVYSGFANDRSSSRAQIPGAIARAPVAEVTLYLADRSSLDRIRGSLDAFIAHWKWLEDRRAKNGTHEGPFGVAPYYFYFGHYYAAQAIEMLPRAERAVYRKSLHDLIFQTQSENGSWNDRVFPRSANYGTAMCMMALQMANAPQLARWEAQEE